VKQNFLMPNSYLSFISGLIAGIIFYVSMYAGYKYLQWPIQRLLGIGQELSLDMLIYLFLYVLFFWGFISITWKKALLSHEKEAFPALESIFQSTTIISSRNQLDDLRTGISHGKTAGRIRDTSLVQTLLFLIDHCLVTQTSERVVEIFTKRMNTLQNYVESSYNILRYITWAIPSVGFIGTVVGIGSALAHASLAMENLDAVIHPLGVAFDTTLIALIESIFLMFFMYNMQHKEETFLNEIDLFCQEKFIINLRLDRKI
jgi:biopolymer transport protein ExbB/TolQ